MTTDKKQLIYWVRGKNLIIYSHIPSSDLLIEKIFEPGESFINVSIVYNQ